MTVTPTTIVSSYFVHADEKILYVNHDTEQAIKLFFFGLLQVRDVIFCQGKHEVVINISTNRGTCHRGQND